jgi:hypothetical protein
MDNASDNWFTLDVAGDATFSGDVSTKHKSSRDLERLVFGDSFSSRLKASKSSGTSDEKKLQSEGSAQKTVSSRKKATTKRRTAAATRDDGDSSSVTDNPPASSDDGVRGDDAVDVAGDSHRGGTPAWQDEDDDAVQACACAAVSSSHLTVCT